MTACRVRDCVALLLAAGRGERLGYDRPKAFVPLAGHPLVQWSLDALGASAQVEQVVVALPPDEPAMPAEVKLPDRAVCVPGGAVRSASVRRALEAATHACELVLVHDAARPLLDAALIERTIAAAQGEGVQGAIAAAAVSDTVKRAEGDPPLVRETLDRRGLWAVQTPQVFRRDVLARALDVDDEALAAATDDAWLVERCGGRVAIVPSDAANLKVTRPVDLELAALLLARRGD